ncbi:MAG: membrane protein insertase YidC [Rhodothermales bacterium]
MDRNVVTATVLITLILLVWFYFITPPLPPPGEGQGADSTLVTTDPQFTDQENTDQEIGNAQPTAATQLVVIDSTFAGAQSGNERIITVDTDLYEAKFSTKGATLVSFVLKEYKQYDQETPVNLVDSTKVGALAMFFTTPTSHNVDTRAFYFDVDIQNDRLLLNEGDNPATLQFSVDVGEGKIIQKYTFTPGTYEVGLSIDQQNAQSFATQEGYDLFWDGGLPYTEGNHETEAIKTASYARTGKDVVGITLDGETYEEESMRGSVSWVSVKNQYFAAVIIPSGETRGAELIGERFGEIDDPLLKEDFEARLQMPASVGTPDEFRLYLGPLEYPRISAYDLGLYDMVDYGWDFFEFMTRPVAKYVFIPIFNFLDDFIPSYGIIIVIMAFLIKGVLYPLTKKSYRSMAQMRELQPKLEALKEKYGENPQKQQEATMKLYRDSGVNPLGGCMPMIFQYPIIIALWQFLPQSIEIRQQGFLWAKDLSAPDVIFNLPFEIPLYGDFVAGFCMLMGISMVFQMRLQSAPSSNPQAKMIMYLMPAMIFFIFNKWAAGLNLYYLCYNVLTAIQQKFINKSIENEKVAEEAEGNKKGGKKPFANKSKSKSNGKSQNGRANGRKGKSSSVKR